jgi:hypothetical protein
MRPNVALSVPAVCGGKGVANATTTDKGAWFQGERRNRRGMAGIGRRHFLRHLTRVLARDSRAFLRVSRDTWATPAHFPERKMSHAHYTQSQPPAAAGR